LSAFGSDDTGIIQVLWRFISRKGFFYKAYDISVRTQTDMSKTSYTAVRVQSSNIYRNQGYGYIFRKLLDIFKPMSCKI